MFEVFCFVFCLFAFFTDDNSFSLSCRCGGKYRVSKDEAEEVTLISCDTCSLIIELLHYGWNCSLNDPLTLYSDMLKRVHSSKCIKLIERSRILFFWSAFICRESIRLSSKSYPRLTENSFSYLCVFILSIYRSPPPPKKKDLNY